MSTSNNYETLFAVQLCGALTMNRGQNFFSRQIQNNLKTVYSPNKFESFTLDKIIDVWN